MNKLGFGFLRLPQKDGQTDFDTLNAMVDHYLAAGGRVFDTAYTYLDGDSERAIQKALSSRYPRDQYHLITKLPGFLATSYEDNFRFFEESALAIRLFCGTDSPSPLLIRSTTGRYLFWRTY